MTKYLKVTQPQLWSMRCDRCRDYLTNPFFWTSNLRAAYRLLCRDCHAYYEYGEDRPFWG